MPIEGALTPPWSVVVVGSRPGYRWCSGSSTFLPIWPIWQQPPNHGGCCPIAAEILVGYRRMRALMKALDPLDQFESSAAHSAAIKAGVASRWRRQSDQNKSHNGCRMRGRAFEWAGESRASIRALIRR